MTSTSTTSLFWLAVLFGVLRFTALNVSAAAPTPAACYDFGTNDVSQAMAASGARGGGALCYLNPTFPKLPNQDCCRRGFKGFAMGGRWAQSPMRTHHNQFLCYNSEPSGSRVRRLSQDKCNQPCPGSISLPGSVTFSPDNGMCGGGCGGCGGDRYPGKCISDPNVSCGQYWSFYECQPGSIIQPVTTTKAPVTPVVTVSEIATSGGPCDFISPSSSHFSYCKDTLCPWCRSNSAYPTARKCMEAEGADYCRLVEDSSGVANKSPCDAVSQASSHYDYCKKELCPWCQSNASYSSVLECLKAEGAGYCKVEEGTGANNVGGGQVDCSRLRAAKDPFYEVYCRETVCNHCRTNKIPQSECLQGASWLAETCKFI